MVFTHQGGWAAIAMLGIHLLAPHQLFRASTPNTFLPPSPVGYKERNAASTDYSALWLVEARLGASYLLHTSSTKAPF